MRGRVVKRKIVESGLLRERVIVRLLEPRRVLRGVITSNATCGAGFYARRNISMGRTNIYVKGEPA